MSALEWLGVYLLVALCALVFWYLIKRNHRLDDD